MKLIDEKRLPKISMRLFFIFFVTVELLLINAGAIILIAVFDEVFPFIHRIPKIIWLFAVSAVMGSALTTMLVKMLFEPITTLGKAMEQVAKGDYSVRLDTKHVFREIRKIHEDFNLMAQELSSTEILKTEFVSNVSHEFKTPINAIEGYATLLQDAEYQAPELRKEYVEKILFNTRRLSRLVGNILLLSKVDNQGIQTRQTTFRLDEQIRQSILALEPRWERKNNDFDVDLQSIEYTGNENLLVHVWNNLLDNAIKYGPEAGLITMRLKREGDSVLFTIEDQGEGIPEEAQKHIFDRFYQGDSSRKAEGNGLGLALVSRIVHLSGGEIAMENRKEGGSRFLVRLPLLEERTERFNNS